MEVNSLDEMGMGVDRLEKEECSGPIKKCYQ